MFPRIVLIALLALLAAPAAHAAPKMWIGFQDDPQFRWNSDRATNLDRAAEAGGTVIRTTVYWSRSAPRRPANARNPFDPAYRLEDVDEMVRGAQTRGMEVYLTIWGTPRWAGPAQNRLPRRLADVTNFAYALAARYSGRYPGYPHVRFYSVWNEPNREIFLAPQFDARGRPVAPANYAKLVRAAYLGIKGGNRLAQVAIGETASNGRDRRLGRRGVQETMSPGKFAELVAKARPAVRFDAWAHHPYPTTPTQKPTQKMRWPNVSLGSLPTFEKSLDKWFRKRNVPVWITEYGHETRPEDRRGVTYSTQGTYAVQALNIARRDPRVQMFVWFILKDAASTPWDSGLLTSRGTKKPAFARFGLVARAADARNAIVKSCATRPVVRFSALPIRYFADRGDRIGVTYDVANGRSLVGRGMAEVAMGVDGWVGLPLDFTPQRGRTYTITLRAGDVNGNEVSRRLSIVCARR